MAAKAAKSPRSASPVKVSKRLKPGAKRPSARTAPAPKKKTAAKKRLPDGSGRSGQAAAANVNFTHIDRIVFPRPGYTKGDVIDFYLRVADKLLPQLKDRPITLERFPEGVKPGAPQFWQKNTPAYYPKWIARAKLATQDDKPVEYTLVNDLESLMYLVNQNVLTFHVWFSRVKPASAADVPDFVLFDVDPHQSTFANAVTVARTLHEILNESGVENFVKTSGKTGLHVMAPWPAAGAKDVTYSAARSWAEAIAQRAAAALPAIATTERMIAKRGQRVYVDAMQNAKGKHAVPPYVLRATPEATVSMPLDWKELTTKLSPNQFDLRTALRRIEKQRTDPLAALTGSNSAR
jgi:bifunctional non-homologous end joining protein LigD